jgi:hypothetical protein
MDSLQAHLKYLRFYAVRDFILRLLSGVALTAVAAIAAMAAFRFAPVLNHNAGAATAVLTLVLVLITAYYAWWTRKLVMGEHQRYQTQHRPILTLTARKFELDEKTGGASGSGRPDAQSRKSTATIELASFKSTAIGVELSVLMPNRWNPDAGDFDYVQVATSVNSVLEHGAREEVVIRLSQTEVSGCDLHEHNAYVTCTLTYEDLLLNVYQQTCYFLVLCHPLGDGSYLTTLSKRYEETYLRAHGRQRSVHRYLSPDGDVRIRQLKA